MRFNPGDVCTYVPGRRTLGGFQGGEQTDSVEDLAACDQSLQAEGHSQTAALWHVLLLDATPPCPSQCTV